MANQRTGQLWILLLCMLSGLTVGYFIGSLCNSISFLKWMDYTGSFGLDQPVQVDLGVIWFSLQVKFNITLTAILGMLAGVFIYKRIR